MQLGAYADVLSGEAHGAGFSGGENRTDLAANGTPRYLLTVTLEPGKEVAAPTMTPESSVAVGPSARGAESAIAASRLAHRMGRLRKDIFEPSWGFW